MRIVLSWEICSHLGCCPEMQNVFDFPPTGREMPRPVAVVAIGEVMVWCQSRYVNCHCRTCHDCRLNVHDETVVKGACMEPLSDVAVGPVPSGAHVSQAILCRQYGGMHGYDLRDWAGGCGRREPR